MRENPTAGAPEPSSSTGSIDIFISYRHEDAPGRATLLYQELSGHFGPEHVFMDIALRPGMNFARVINERVARCGVLIALIGPRWASSADERARRRLLDNQEDFVRIEIEAALRRDSGVRVIPVLVDEAEPLSAETLPRPLKPLAFIQAATLEHDRWNDDVQGLIDQIDQIALEVSSKPEAPSLSAPKPAVPDTGQPDEGREESAHEPVAPPPGRSHYQQLAALIVEKGTVVPFLGSAVNVDDRDEDWHDGCGYLPGTDELAAHLARQFDFARQPADLAEVSQYVSLTWGTADLYGALRRILTADFSPSSVHRFLAGLPAKLQELGLPARYQLIVTTNYDDALERAFDAAEEPYDRAVYMASGRHRGRFLHIPFDAEPTAILVPNQYVDFPIEDDGELARTVIVKIHGAVDSGGGPYRWKDNYVVTEDHYIDYLSQCPIEDVLPMQILDKMRASHVLFLGHAVHDWNLRVFLQRIWGEQRPGGNSWAIHRHPEIVDKEFWNAFGVEVFAAPLAGYVNELGEYLAPLGEAPARP